MAIYTVQIPDNEPDVLRRAERARFIREGFSWASLVLGPLWLLYHRLWWALAGWCALTIALMLAAYAAGLPPLVSTGLTLLVSLWLGLEGNDLRRKALERSRFRLADVVAAGSRDEAERRFFERADLTGMRRSVAVASAPAARVSLQPEVLGLFPDSRGRA